MKTRSVEKWFVEWDKHLRHFAVKSGRAQIAADPAPKQEECEWERQPDNFKTSCGWATSLEPLPIEGRECICNRPIKLKEVE